MFHVRLEQIEFGIFEFSLSKVGGAAERLSVAIRSCRWWKDFVTPRQRSGFLKRSRNRAIFIFAQLNRMFHGNLVQPPA